LAVVKLRVPATSCAGGVPAPANVVLSNGPEIDLS
jgi:hypothetical protein